MRDTGKTPLWIYRIAALIAIGAYIFYKFSE